MMSLQALQRRVKGRERQLELLSVCLVLIFAQHTRLPIQPVLSI